MLYAIIYMKVNSVCLKGIDRDFIFFTIMSDSLLGCKVI